MRASPSLSRKTGEALKFQEMEKKEENKPFRPKSTTNANFSEIRKRSHGAQFHCNELRRMKQEKSQPHVLFATSTVFFSPFFRFVLLCRFSVVISIRMRLHADNLVNCYVSVKSKAHLWHQIAVSTVNCPSCVVIKFKFISAKPFAQNSTRIWATATEKGKTKIITFLCKHVH